MTNLTKYVIQFVLITVFLASSTATAAGKRKEAPNPDFTKGDQSTEFHDWNLGPTGLRGWIYGRKGQTSDARQILVTGVAEKSPADGIFQKGDVILGVAGRPFNDDARIQFSRAVITAEKQSNGGRMKLLRWRDGKTENVTLQLAVVGTYSDTAPYNCPKSKTIFEHGCQAIAKNGLDTVTIPNSLNALALLASGSRQYRPMLREYAQKVAAYDSKRSTWHTSYAILFLAEYVAATGDSSVLDGLMRLALEAARGASPVGTYGHRYAESNGRCPGYGAMNQPTIAMWMALIVSRQAGIQHSDIDKTIAATGRFMRWYVNKGSIPYGDHEPWFGHEDNGKNSSATVCFDLLGDRDAAEFFAKMSLAAYNERERGHTGNFFNVLWAMPGVSRCGEIAAGAYMKELAWYYDLAREFDGSFGYQGSPQGEEEHRKYTDWDCTGAYMLAYAVPLKSLYITGKKPCSVEPLNRTDVNKVITAGRGYFLATEGNGSLYEGRKPHELVAGLSSWSPVVRERSARSLARTNDRDYVPILIKMLYSPDVNTRYGACQALALSGARADKAAPKLQALLKNPDPWMQSLAATAISKLGTEAYKDSVPELLRILVSTNPADPRNMAHRYAAEALFDKGRIVRAGLLDSIDRQLLYSAIRSTLSHEDGWTRSLAGNIYPKLSDRDLKVMLPDILKATQELAPSGMMFASNIRMAGLELLTERKISQGMDLLADYITNQRGHGSEKRIVAVLEMLKMYGAHAQRVIPKLEEAAGYFEERGTDRLEKVARNNAKLLRETIKYIEASKDKPKLISL